MILLMGIPGSGKGTQGKLLAGQLGLHLLSMGDVLREHATVAQRERMQAGDLLSDEEAIGIIDEVLNSLPQDKVILDGFPRSIPQAEWLLEQALSGRFDMQAAFYLVASPEAVRKRMLERARDDDAEATITKRFEEYERSTVPIMKWLTDQGLPVIEVNAERPIEAINHDLVNYIKEL